MRRFAVLCFVCLLASVAWAGRSPVAIKADIRAAEASLKAGKAVNADVSAVKMQLAGLHKELQAVTPQRAASLDDGGETCDTAEDVTSVPYTDFGVISTETGDDYVYADVCGLEGQELVYRIVVGPNGIAAGTYTINTCGSDFDTVVELWDDCPSNENAQLVDCNDDLNEDDNNPICMDGNFGLSSCISAVELTEGTYYLVVFGYDSLTGDYELNINSNGECGGNHGSCSYTANNATCATAQNVVLDGNGLAYAFGNTIGGGNTYMAGCWDSEHGYQVDITTCGLWYTVTGTGNIMHANTCDEETDFDTQIHVFSGSCDALECVEANDDWFYVNDAGEAIYQCGLFDLASGLEWCSNAGQTYYIFVNGYESNEGNFGLHVEDTGEPCTAPCEEQWYYFTPDQVPFCQCLTICPGQIQKIFIGPAGPNDYPVASWHDGCATQRNIPPDGCDSECNPAYPQLYMDWIYLPEEMLWCMDIYSVDGGCYCFCIDRILPVELNSFSAIPGDRQVAINWTTASETDADRFEITRDGVPVANVAAHNSATGAAYTWTDVELTNGTAYSYTLTLVNLNGTRDVLVTESVTPSASGVANNFALYQNYPNPFNPQTNISFDLVQSGQISLKVYNVAGQEIATVANGYYAAGRHAVTFDGSALASGVYLYRLDADGQVAQHKMVLLK